MHYILWQNRHVFQFESIGQFLFCTAFVLVCMATLVGIGYLIDKVLAKFNNLK